MKRSFLIVLLIFISILFSACSNINSKYQQIGEYNGITLYLNTESINYNKANGTVSYWTKLVYTDKAKSDASTNWAKSGRGGVNPFLELNQSLILYEAMPVIKKDRIIEINYMDKDDKSILRTPFNDSAASWKEITPDTVPGKTYQAVMDILQKQNKL